MAAVYLYEKPIPDVIAEKVMDKFFSMGFKIRTTFSDNSHFLEAGSGEQIIVDSIGGIRFIPKEGYLEDVIARTEFYRSILHKIDPRFKVYDNILIVSTGLPERSLYNDIVSGYRVRYEYEKYKNGRRKKYGRVIFKLKYLS